ncbi:SurA N-terminal domain-containing protein [Neisseria sp. S1]|uniref:SurA N-terminal domain-containing protein n=1 Tax=Neisseria sp. S1 TaxID=3318354 RepID=UPI003A86BFE5
MFSTVDKYSGAAKVLLGLIALTFVGFGASTVAAPGSDYIVKVGDIKISAQALNDAMQNAQAAGGQQSRDAVFQGLLQRAYLTQGAKLMGIGVSQEQIKQIIVDDPSFHDASGKFSQALLTQYLQQRNMSEDRFVEDIREQFALQNMVNLVQNGVLVSDAQAAQLVNLLQSERTIRSVTFSPEAFAVRVKTDDVTLKNYYEANKKDYVIPQAVKIEYVELNMKDLADKQAVSEEEIKKAFEQEKTSAQPQREVAHIFFPVAQDADEATRKAAEAEAEKVLAQVKAKPADFAVLAKQYSKDPASADNGGNLGYVKKDGGLGAAFENSAFSLPKDEVSGVVKTEYGYHIIKVLNIKDQAVLDDEEKARITAELKQRKASQAFNKAKETLAEEAFNNPNALTEVAKKTGLKVAAPDEWLNRENGKAAGMPEELLKVIFSDDVLKKKHNSEPVTVNENTVWVVRAKEVREESTESFENAKALVKANYLRSETAKLAEAEAKKMLVDLNNGEKPTLAWSPVVKQTADEARRSMPPEAYTQLLKARPVNGKPAYVLLEGLPAPVLLEVQAVNPPADIEAQLPLARQMLAQGQANGIFENLMTYLQRTVKQKQGAQKVAEGTE